MRFIGLRRRSGKTETIIDWYRQDPEHRRIAVIDTRERERLASQYEIPFNHLVLPIISFDSSPALNGTQNIEVAIDNVDILLQRMFRYSVSFCTYTRDAIGDGVRSKDTGQ